MYSINSFVGIHNDPWEERIEQQLPISALQAVLVVSAGDDGHNTPI